MLKKDKNGFIEIIKQEGYEPSDFFVQEDVRDNSPAFILRYKESPMEFWYRNSSRSYFDYDCNFIRFSPTFLEAGYFPEPDWGNNIDFVYAYFKEWLENDLKIYLSEQEAPDMWGLISNSDTDYLWRGDNETYFSSKEKEVVISLIDQFRENILEHYKPNDEQYSDINVKLDYLASAVDRLNKFDWKSVLISTLLGVSTTLSLDKSNGVELVNLAKEIFNQGLLFLM